MILVFAERGRSTFKGFEEPVEVIEALAAARRREVPPARATGAEGETAGGRRAASGVGDR